MSFRCAYNAQTESLAAVLFLREGFPIGTDLRLRRRDDAADEVDCDLEGDDLALEGLEDEDVACEEPNEDLEASLPEFEEVRCSPRPFAPSIGGQGSWLASGALRAYRVAQYRPARLQCEELAPYNTWHMASLVEAHNRRILLAFHVIFCNVVVILHAQVVQLLRGRIDEVWFPKGGLQGLFEGVPSYSVIGKVVLLEGKLRFVPHG